MRPLKLMLLLTLMSPAGAAAPGVGSYVTAGLGSIDYVISREAVAQVSGGILFRLADDRVRIGVCGDVLSSHGYFSGRGGPLAEFALLPRGHRVRPFAGAGILGADGGAMWMVGGGVDIWLRDAFGVRVAVQDALRSSTVYLDLVQGTAHTFHEPSFQVGIVWR